MRKGTSAMLLPAKAEVARQLNKYRAWERVMLAAPSDRSARDSFEDSGYTLCVLMGKRCAREAAHAAERYLRTSLVAYLREQAGWTHTDRFTGHSPPTVQRSAAGG